MLTYYHHLSSRFNRLRTLERFFAKCMVDYRYYYIEQDRHRAHGRGLRLPYTNTHAALCRQCLGVKFCVLATVHMALPILPPYDCGIFSSRREGRLVLLSVYKLISCRLRCPLHDQLSPEVSTIWPVSYLDRPTAISIVHGPLKRNESSSRSSCGLALYAGVCKGDLPPTYTLHGSGNRSSGKI